MTDDKLPPENAKVQKTWTFKKQENGKFKVFDRETGVLLEGFEDQEWGSPLEGGRFLHKILADVEAAAATSGATFAIGGQALMPKVGQVGDVPKTTMTITKGAGDAQQIARTIDKAASDEILEAREGNELVKKLGVTRMFKIIIPKQSNTDNNHPVFVPNHDGGKPWNLVRGKEHIVPEYVYNILQESIATATDYDFQTGSQGVKAVATIERIPRFSVQLLGEIRV